ncbi:MAG TPA: lysylphosphatidylglycerol synthase transmembrane domain-containing protein [Ktedonobacterales bacterium]|nr:lysylphosphatidylglycerol synthase transmembrane domain-containing protein [Ktedonobacterales bacterium]
MRRFFRPNVIIPFVLGISLLAGVLAFGNINRVVALMLRFPHALLPILLLLVAVYEGLRCVQFSVLLKSLGVVVPVDRRIFAFLGGEVAQYAPLGNYFPNYLLRRSDGVDFGLSSAATTMMVLIQVAVSLAGLVILGIDGWDWLRPVIVIGLIVSGLIVWAAYRAHFSPHPPPWMLKRSWIRRGLEELRRFREGTTEEFIHPRTLTYATALGAAYIFVGGLILYMLIRGLGFSGVVFWQAQAAFDFSLAFALIFPLPIDFGTLEVSTVGALLAVGLERSAAVGVALLYRLVLMGGAMAIFVAALLVLRNAVRYILRRKPPHQASTEATTSV